MNPRQRRGVVFLVVAALGAIAVFFSVVGYVNNVQNEVGNKVSAFVVSDKNGVDAYTTVTPAQLRRIEMPERWLPATAVHSLQDLDGMVSATALPPGTLIQGSTLIPKPTLRTGQRELAIMVDAETGVAGKLERGDRVDVWATYDDLGQVKVPRTKVIAQNLLIIDVGLPAERDRRASTGALDRSKAVPVTFALGEQEIKALTYAEGVAGEIRLALRPPGDTTLIPGDRRSYAESLGVVQDASPTTDSTANVGPAGSSAP